MSTTAQARWSQVQNLRPRKAPVSARWLLEVPQWAFLVLLSLGPACFGATEPWSLLLIETGVVAVFILWIAISWRHVHLELDLATAVLLLFGLLVTAQMFFGVTVYRYATEQELLRINAYFIFFFLARHLFQTRQPRVWLAGFLALFGGAQAMFAIVQKLQGNGQIYWMRATSTQSFFGSYANKNHYAGLMEMLVPFALFNAAKTDSELSKRALFAFVASVMIASVLLSGSRTGMLVILVEVTLFAALILRRSPKNLPRSRISAVLLVIAVAFVLWIAGGALVSQTADLRNSASDASLFNRVQVAHDSLELVKQRPILGWGLGTFPTVYPQVATWYSDFVVNAAHNDYLQLQAETGIVGLGLLLLFLLTVLRAGITRTLDQPASIASAAVLGCIGLLLHSFTDFNLHVPANAAIFFALCGMICAGPAPSAIPSSTSRA